MKLYKSELVTRKSCGYGRLVRRVARRCYTGERFELTNKMRLVRIPAMVSYVGKQCIVFDDQVQTVLKAMYFRIQFWCQPCVLQKYFLKVSGRNTITGCYIFNVIEE